MDLKCLNNAIILLKSINKTHVIIVMLKLFFLTLIIYCNGFSKFINKMGQFSQNQFFAEKRFKPVNEEKTLQIHHENQIFNKLNHSLYAQIGSNPKYLTNTSYSWFDGDGMIHAVLFENNKITYQNKWIQTERLKYEDKLGKKVYLYLAEFLDNNGLIDFMIYSLKKYFHLIPSVKGTANTALLEHKKKLYALHEGDLPYELDIDYNELNISTKGNIDLQDLYSTTAHPIVDWKRKLLYLFSYNNYDFSKGMFIFNSLDKDLNLITQKNISLINNGILHSVSFTGDKLIIPDMPLKIDPMLIFKKKLPIHFDKRNGVTRFGILDVDILEKPEWYYFHDNFYVFHFSDAYENDEEYIIYACVIKDPDMESFIHFEKNNPINRANGVLREIRLNKTTKQGYVVQNEKLNNIGDLNFLYNIDFPYTSKINKNDIYCSIFNSDNAYMCGVLKINTHNFKDSHPDIFIFNEGTYGIAEFQSVIIDNIEYLLGFIEEKDKCYISLIDVPKKTIEKIEIPSRIPPGFHSIHYYV